MRLLCEYTIQRENRERVQRDSSIYLHVLFGGMILEDIANARLSDHVKVNCISLLYPAVILLRCKDDRESWHASISGLVFDDWLYRRPAYLVQQLAQRTGNSSWEVCDV